MVIMHFKLLTMYVVKRSSAEGGSQSVYYRIKDEFFIDTITPHPKLRKHNRDDVTAYFEKHPFEQLGHLVTNVKYVGALRFSTFLEKRYGNGEAPKSIKFLLQHQLQLEQSPSLAPAVTKAPIPSCELCKGAGFLFDGFTDFECTMCWGTGEDAYDICIGCGQKLHRSERGNCMDCAYNAAYDDPDREHPENEWIDHWRANDEWDGPYTWETPPWA